MSSSPIPLPGLMDIAACGAVQQNLSDLVASQPMILLDASAVERISTPGIQLLYSAWLAAKNAGKELELLNPSSALSLAIEDLGLTDPFRIFTIMGEK